MNILKKRQCDHYNNFTYNVSPKIFERVKRYHVKNVIGLIKNKPKGDEKVLFIACGTGYEIKLFGGGIGADISFNCVKNVVRLGFPGVTCDITDLPFKSNSFDYVFSNSFHHFYNFEKAFSEIYRVCRKGGRIVLGPESHRYSLDQYLYNTLFGYWDIERGVLTLTPQKLIRLFKNHKIKCVKYYHKGIDFIAVSGSVERLFDFLIEKLPNFLFFWAHFYITGIK